MSGFWRVAVLLAALMGARQATAAEVIHSFESDVRVAKDGELTVTETLSVRAEGIAMRHGIYRDFPLLFKDAGGRVHEVTFNLLSVSRDGNLEPYHTEHTRGVIRIYAGSKDMYVRPGEHTYVFTYRTGRQIHWFDGKPQLNWNVTGNFWRFPIELATYQLHLFDGAAPLRWTAFTGRRGARGRDWEGSLGALGTLSVSTTRRLVPGEGLTVVAALPANVVEPPSANTLLWYQLFDNRQWIIAGIGFLALIGFYFVSWEKVGRDPKPGTVVPLFHPPEGISPALASYIRNWGFGQQKWRAFTAGALSLAVRGLIRFEQSDKALTLKMTGTRPSGGLPAGEDAIYGFVTGSSGIVTIDRHHGQAVANAGDEFTKSIEAENRNRYFRRNLGYVVAGVAMTIAVVAAVMVYGGLPDQDLSILVVLGFGGFMIGTFIVPVFLALFGGGRKVGTLVFAAVTMIIASSFALIVVGAGRKFVDASGAWPMLRAMLENDPFPFVLAASFTALNGLFFYLMKAPTALGRSIMDQLEGFRLYLQTAESDRLNMQVPEITTERFEALLPYAVALDVETPWAHAFQSALRRAHPGDPDAMPGYRPGWSSGGGWSGDNFGSAVSTSVAGVSDAFASAVPVSSGSSGFGGGGGGSGGGGGGGGGGGW